MKKVKKIVAIIIISVILMNFNCLILNRTYAINEGNIDFEDDNFKKALIEEGVDTNQDGEISFEEAMAIRELHLWDKNISSISGIKYFKNLEFLNIEDNDIEDISECVELMKLQSLFISHNKINSSPLRTIDKSVKLQIESMFERGVNIEGIYNQTIDYNPNLVESQPEYKVLFVYVTEIDANVINNGNIYNYKHTLSEDEIHYFELQRDIFEKAVEKLSNYSVNITTDVYYTTEKITEYGGYEDDYWLTKDDINEIEDISNNYDTIFVCAIYDYAGEIVPHHASGLGSRGQSMVYFQYDSQNDINYQIELLKNDKLSYDLPTMIHEFIHSVECYGEYMDFKIWEWHSASDYYSYIYYKSSNDELLQESFYLQGCRNPNDSDETGIVKELWEIPLSKIFGKSIVMNKESVDVEEGNTKQLYCATKILNQTPADIAGWTFKNIIWSSDNESIATVNENGIITAKSIGQCTITATDSTRTYSTTCVVNVIGNENERQIREILINEEPTNKVFVQGDEIKFTDGTLTIIYSDDTEAEVFLQDPRITISNYNSYMLGEQTITINFEGASTELTITVIEEEEISSIQISTEPNAIEYKEGEGLDLTGGKLLVKYKDDSEKEISLLDFRIKISNYNPNMLGEQTVTINFKGATTELTITVIGTEKEISSIQVSTEPNKIEYKKGEELDLAGGKLLVKYQDETEEEIDLTTEGITFSNYNPDSIGKQPIYIHYKGKMTGLWIEVVENNNQETDNNYWKFLPYLIARDSENGYLENIEQGTTCKDIIDVAYTNGRIEIYKDDKLVEDLNEKLATGMIVKVIFTNEEYSYKVVVAGDINGDAEVDELDLLMLARYNAGYEKETQMVVNEYLRAANVHKDEDFGDVLDLLKLARMLVNLD